MPQLGDEQSSNGFVQGSSVHVDRSTDRNHKPGHARIDTHVVQTSDCDRHRCWAGSGTECSGQHLTHLGDIRVCQLPRGQEKDDSNCAYICMEVNMWDVTLQLKPMQLTKTVQHQPQHHCHKVPTQLTQNLHERSHLKQLGCDQEEHTDRWNPNNPRGDDHHGLAQGFEQTLQGFSSFSHLSDAGAEHHAEHYQTKHVSALGEFRSDFVVLQRNWGWDFSDRWI